MRLGKRERSERRGQWALVKEAKRLQIASNMEDLKSLPTSKGYVLSPDMRVGYSFNNPSNLGRSSRFGMDGTKYGAK